MWIFEPLVRKCSEFRSADVLGVAIVLVISAGTYWEATRRASDVTECLASVNARSCTSDALGLYWLSINGQQLGRSEFFELLPRLADVETLILSRSSFQNAQLASLQQLRHLRSLSLRDTNTDDRGLSYIGDCIKLETLCLDGTRVTNQGISHLAALQNLKTLSLSGSDVDDDCIDALADITTLVSLDVRSTGITKQGLRRLEALKPDCQISSNVAELRLIARREHRRAAFGRFRQRWHRHLPDATPAL